MESRSTLCSGGGLERGILHKRNFGTPIPTIAHCIGPISLSESCPTKSKKSWLLVQVNLLSPKVGDGR